MEVAKGLRNFQLEMLSVGWDGDVGTFELSHLLAICILHNHLKCGGERFLAAVAHFCFRMDGCLACLHVDVLCIDVGSSSAEGGVEGQCLINGRHDVEIHILAQATIVDVEVLVVPLVLGTRRLLLVVPIVVGLHLDEVVSFLQIRGEFEAKCHHAVFTHTESMSVEIDLCHLASTFEFNEHFAAFLHLGQAEMLTIPHHAIAEVVNQSLIGFVFVPSMGKRHLLSSQFPIGIEIIGVASLST